MVTPGQPPGDPVEPPGELGPASPVRADGVATPRALHVGNRLSYGVTPALVQDMVAAGSVDDWVEQQLDPTSIADPAGDALESWWSCLSLDHTAIVQRNKDLTESGGRAMDNYARWCLHRRIASRRQLLEVMTEFWEHHLHVPLRDDGVYPHRIQYGKVLRSHALGRFEDMLIAAITHPAMGISLDNAASTKRAPNENLGRELLELHTVGRGNHTEDDVKNAARVLTGYRVDTWRSWDSTYDPSSHWTGPVRVLDFSHANSSADGRPVTEALLSYLANHPATAQRIARKLAIRFVSDDPSAELVDHLAQAYLAGGTDIPTVVRALVAHPEFASAAGSKVRTPTDDVVATHRVLGTRFHPPGTNEGAAANQVMWHCRRIGQTPFAWPRPDGPPDRGPAWSSASRLLASFEVHQSIVFSWAARDDVDLPSERSWVPRFGMRFDALVDHLSVQLLGRHAPPRLVEAACAALQVRPQEAMTAQHPVVQRRIGSLLTALLDTPDHLHR